MFYLYEIGLPVTLNKVENYYNILNSNSLHKILIVRLNKKHLRTLFVFGILNLDVTNIKKIILGYVSYISKKVKVKLNK